MGLDHYACKRAYLSNDKLIGFLEEKAKFVGVAEFTDHVLRYTTIKSMDTDKNLLWVRHIHKNAWSSMKVGKFYPFHKSDIQFESGFQFFKMPIGSPSIECSSLKEAKVAFEDKTDEWFSFKRTTREYLFDDISVYIEDIDYIGVTVEFVCRTESQSLKQNMAKVDRFMKDYDVKKIISHQAATLVRKARRI